MRSGFIVEAGAEVGEKPSLFTQCRSRFVEERESWGRPATFTGLTAKSETNADNERFVLNVNSIVSLSIMS